MVYGTNRLYAPSRKVAAGQVVETADGRVVAITPFVCELHSMLWYDAIVVCGKMYKKQLFHTMDELLASVGCDNDVNTPLYAYGVNFDAGCWLFEPLR